MGRTVIIGRWASAVASAVLVAACSSSGGADPGTTSVTATDGGSSVPTEITDAPSTSAASTDSDPGDGGRPAPPATCEHTGAGTDYAVGPDQAYATIGDVPWASLTAGDSVRIFWRDEPYREKFLIQGQGTEDQPIVVCGVPGPGGEMPIIDGQDATTAPDMGYSSVEGQGRGLIHVSLGDDDEYGFKPAHIVIQGLHIRNAYSANQYTGTDGAAVPYFENAAGIFVERGDGITVRDVELDGNGNGFFVASGDSEEVRSHDIVLERSFLHDNGTPDAGQDQRHNIYTEADGIVFQYNEIGPMAPGALGAALKDRSTGTVIRYNRITGGARSLDLVDAEDSSVLAQDDPDYRTTLVYGNVIVNDAAVHGPDLSNMIHYGGDSGLPENYRQGVLYFAHNTVIVRADQDGPPELSRYQTSLFDLDTEDERAVIVDNVFFVRSSTPGATPTLVSWGRGAGTIELGANWASPGIVDWRYPDETTGTVSGAEDVQSNDDNDPGFVDEAGNDFAPAAGSPLIDAGAPLPDDLTALGVGVTEEYAGRTGRARGDDGAPDLGAFESAGGAAAPSNSDAPPASATDGTGGDTGPGEGDDAGSTGGTGSPTIPTGDFSLPEGSPSLAGKGPRGADNGDASACGDGVLCVGGSGSYASINDAIADAAAGDVIQVAAGTYTENVALGSFTALDPRNLTLLGGFSADFATRDAASNRTIIDGGGDDPAVQLHVLSDETTVLDGFVLTNGTGLGSTFDDGGGGGGGVFAQQQGDGELVISHNEIFANTTRIFDDGARGGGIHADAIDWDGGTPTIRIEDNDIHDNEAGRGAGIEVRGHAAVIANNLVERNLAQSDHGGGVYLSALDNTVTANVVRANEVGVTAGYGWGGGILIAGVRAAFEGNVVTENFAPSSGSGVFWDEAAVGTMSGDLLVANRCPLDTQGLSGAAIYVDGGDPGPSQVTAEAITVAGNACADVEGGAAIKLEGGSSIDITGSVLWANGLDVATAGGDDRFTIEDSTTSADDDPQFTDAAAGDFSLRPGSPASGRGA